MAGMQRCTSRGALGGGVMPSAQRGCRGPPQQPAHRWLYRTLQSSCWTECQPGVVCGVGLSARLAKSFGLLRVFIQLLSERKNDSRSASPPNAQEQGPSSEGFSAAASVSLPLALKCVDRSANALTAEQRRFVATRVPPPPPLPPPLPLPLPHLFPALPHSLTAAMEVPSRELFIGGSWVRANQRLPDRKSVVEGKRGKLRCGGINE